MMLKKPMLNRSMSLGVIVAAVACGKPMDPSGKEDALFVKASMGMPTAEGADRPLAADLAVEPVSMLVMFNRLQSPDKLQDALNKKPGQFSHLDIDKDGAPDPLTVAAKDAPDGHAFEIRVKPNSGEFVVATMMFDKEWQFLGHYNGLMGGQASTVGRPLPAAPMTGAAPPMPTQPPSTAPTPVSDAAPTGAPATAPTPTTPTPAPAGDPAGAVAGSVQAVPTGSGAEAGVKATP